MVKKPRNMAMQRQISPGWKRPVLLNAFRVNCKLSIDIQYSGRRKNPPAFLQLIPMSSHYLLAGDFSKVNSSSIFSPIKLWASVSA
ncbi:hypothetical protein SPSPH_027220 [Sporomusa sphaeroides DSM 2875]|uniref:Uncharacterized protein n=1 Tax=Sporomusa sphaeroides DSM 2875 TaxID=1337886 RepID=A0ABP2C6B5_9FIRM|nr:hypothetical protein SPSPH_30310 [Sporomusa sphaeroides DSM 2875]CVK19372.1 hypothetical protein SSPH_02023 [Sporomusa sphaeroides DSM 2875]